MPDRGVAMFQWKSSGRLPSLSSTTSGNTRVSDPPPQPPKGRTVIGGSWQQRSSRSSLEPSFPSAEESLKDGGRQPSPPIGPPSFPREMPQPPIYRRAASTFAMRDTGDRDPPPRGDMPIFRRAHTSVMERRGSRHSVSVPQQVDVMAGLKQMEQSMCGRLDSIELLLRRLDAPQKFASQVPPQLSPAVERDVTVWAASTTMATMGEQDAEPLSSECLKPPHRADSHHSVSASCSPGQWAAASLALREEWRSTNFVDIEAVVVDRKIMDTIRQNEDDSSEFHQQRTKPPWVLLPSSRFRLIWDILMVIVIGYDMAVVPVSLAFDVGDNIVSAIFFWPFLVYWTMDVPLNFVTGYYNRRGQTETQIWNISLNYLRSWFVIDACVLGASWWEVWLRITAQDAFLLGRAGKSLRILRVLRAFRVLRLAKIQKIMREFESRITSDYLRIIIQVLKLILTIIWLNHFVACAWFAIGVNNESDTSWTKIYGYETAPLPLQYFTSLHWSLTQFTPASMDVSAQSLSERIFSVVVLLFAMVTFSSFVSSLTAASTQLRQLTDYRDANFSVLRRYLRSRRVPVDLSLRVLHCVDYRLGKQKMEIQEKEVHFLELVSKPLQMELALHIFAPVLTKHPFFSRYSEVDSVSMRKVCTEAVSQIALYTEDHLFTEGSVCEQMFFLLSGLLHYESRGDPAGASEHGEKDSTSGSLRWFQNTLDEGGWCSELCLWFPWIHKGTMVANQTAEVLTVNASAFLEITSSFPLVFRLTTRYATVFAETLREQMIEGQNLTDLTMFTADSLETLVERAYFKRTVAGEVVDADTNDATDRSLSI